MDLNVKDPWTMEAILGKTIVDLQIPCHAPPVVKSMRSHIDFKSVLSQVTPFGGALQSLSAAEFAVQRERQDT